VNKRKEGSDVTLLLPVFNQLTVYVYLQTLYKLVVDLKQLLSRESVSRNCYVRDE